MRDPAADQDAFVERGVAIFDDLDGKDAYKYRLTESAINAWVKRHQG